MFILAANPGRFFDLEHGISQLRERKREPEVPFLPFAIFRINYL
jgi:hypothetical protein